MQSVKKRINKFYSHFNLVTVASLFFMNAGYSTEVAPYFYTWAQGNPVYAVQSLTDARQKANLDAVTLAFEVSAGGCNLTSNVENMITDVRNFISLGGRVIVSFGGAAGNYIQSTCTNSTDLFNVLNSYIQRTGIRNLDFDIEGDQLGDAAANNRLIAALRQLRTRYPDLYVSYTLPVDARTGLDSNALTLLRNSESSGLRVDIINILAFDFYYTLPGQSRADMAIMSTEITASQLRNIYPGRTNAQIYSMIGITVMIGENDDGTIFTINDARRVTDYAIQNNIGLLSYWAFQRDQVGRGSIAIYSNVNNSNFQFYSVIRTADNVGPNPSPSPTPSPNPSPTPSPSPAPTPGPGCQQWTEGRQYNVGNVVTYQGSTYTAIQSHFSYPGAGWNPVATPSLWRRGGTCTSPSPSPQPSPTPTPKPSPSPTPAPGPGCQQWTEGRQYNVGNVVTYQGNTYTAIQSHFAYPGAGWNPVATPSLWRRGGTCSIVAPTEISHLEITNLKLSS
ncbi:MAG: carbohydrate-binding protein [Bdellovibrionia bacterium]